MQSPRTQPPEPAAGAVAPVPSRGEEGGVGPALPSPVPSADAPGTMLEPHGEPRPAAPDGGVLPLDPRPAVFPVGPTVPRGKTPLGMFLGVLRTGVLALAFYTIFFHLSIVRGRSMAPGIQDGDRILVEPWSYTLASAKRGDVVVLRYPLDPTLDYIKRVIGLPGDRVTMADGHVWVNGELLDEPYVRDVDRRSFVDVRVADSSYFVLGDNRPRSSDSREFGQVPGEYIRGRVDVRLWPPSRAGWVR